MQYTRYYTAINKDFIAIYKDCTAINKDFTAIYQDRTAIDKDFTAIYKDCTAINKDFIAIYKILHRDKQGFYCNIQRFTAINKNCNAINKDFIAIYKDCTAINKDFIAIYKDCTAIDKDFTAIYKDCTAIDKDFIAIYKDCTALQTPTTGLHSFTSLLQLMMPQPPKLTNNDQSVFPRCTERRGSWDWLGGNQLRQRRHPKTTNKTLHLSLKFFFTSNGPPKGLVYFTLHVQLTSTPEVTSVHRMSTSPVEVTLHWEMVAGF